jgi:hypothetical protein
MIYFRMLVVHIPYDIFPYPRLKAISLGHKVLTWTYCIIATFYSPTITLIKITLLK